MKPHILILAALLTAVSQSKRNEKSVSTLGKDLLSLLKKSLNLNIKGLSPKLKVVDLPDQEHLEDYGGQSFHLKESDELQEERTTVKQKTLPSHPEKIADYKFKSSDHKYSKDALDAKEARHKARVVVKARNKDKWLNDDQAISSRYNDGKLLDKSIYRMDPVMNEIRMKMMRRSGRRNAKSSSSDSSSSREMKDWKQEWNEIWMAKKLEALNTSAPRGDMLNMVAARPWGVPCGDPNKHDMPWGTCMLAAECDSEYRIYRGDYFCGRTHFICCSLQTNTYDLYQGFDVSFEDSSFETEEHDGNSKEKRRKRKEKQKKKRKRLRDQRKKKIKNKIKKIVREVERILNKAYRNGSSVRKKKTKTLKKYIKYLKKKYRKDRDTVKDIHEIQMIKLDGEMMKRIQMVKDVNRNFMQNETFREIILKGTMTVTGARMLVEAYPELGPYIGVDNTRRAGAAPGKDYLDYDIEYGPWGTPCGDPNKHDMPWGTCMLAAECDSEYRVYRGDYFCGRTHFICCALQQNTYDLYNGFDQSFEDSAIITDENADREGGSKEKRKRQKAKERNHRKKVREKRKKQIKSKVQKIIREVERILNKAYRNGSTIRKKKTKALKKYIKYMKKKFRKDRDAMKGINEAQLYNLDRILLKRIEQVKDVNTNFMQNETFRNIVMSGKMSASGGRMLAMAYPELGPYLGMDNTRRSGAAPAIEDLDYDIEYGLLFS